MKLAGLIGYPLSHTFSPSWFTRRFAELGLSEWSYTAFPLKDIADLPDLIRNQPDLRALNVTIPHKQAVLDYCAQVSPEVEATGAANLIIIRRSGIQTELSAYNTDVYGFAKSLENWFVPDGRKALVLGSGGAARAVAYVLKGLGLACDVAGRSGPLRYEQISLKPYGLIVNCTPAGMYSEGTQFPELLDLPYAEADAGQQFFDLVYNPAETPMMRRFAAAGARVINGLEMLHLQAEKGLEIILSETDN